MRYGAKWSGIVQSARRMDVEKGVMKMVCNYKPQYYCEINIFSKFITIPQIGISSDPSPSGGVFVVNFIGEGGAVIRLVDR